jgi:hypothetical protein
LRCCGSVCDVKDVKQARAPSFGPVYPTVVFSLPPSAFPEEHLALKSGRPIYAIVMLVLSSLFMCATFLPLLYSVVVPNEDLKGVVSALEERSVPSLESETEVLSPQYSDKVYAYAQPAFFGEVAFMLWLIIKGAKPPALDAAASLSAAG